MSRTRMDMALACADYVLCDFERDRVRDSMRLNYMSGMRKKEIINYAIDSVYYAAYALLHNQLNARKELREIYKEMRGMQ